MPKIDDLANESKKKFKKSVYRPWNYMDEMEKETKALSQETSKQSTASQLKIALATNKTQATKGSKTDWVGIARENKCSDGVINREEKTTILELKNNETALDIIFRLIGHQKEIFIFIVERCMSRGLLSTGAIKGETLVNLTNTTLKMVKTSIQRIILKGLIVREKGKTGRGGFYTFRITEAVRNAAIEYKRIAAIGNKLETNEKLIRNQNNPKIASVIENGVQNNTLSEEWVKINIEPLSEIGFTYNHLMDIAEPELADPQVVQESIFHFAYGLEYETTKYKKYNDVLNVLIGRLRKGKGWIEKNYRTPKEIAQDKLNQQRKIERERLKNLKEEAYDLALQEWQDTLSPEQIEKIAPAKKSRMDITPQRVKLSLYFKENLWPAKKSDYLVSD